MTYFRVTEKALYYEADEWAIFKFDGEYYHVLVTSNEWSDWGAPIAAKKWDREFKGERYGTRFTVVPISEDDAFLELI